MTLTDTYTHNNGVRVDTYESEATYVGKGEFYSGLKQGDRVTVQTTVYTHTDGHTNTSTSVRSTGAWLAIHDASVLV